MYVCVCVCVWTFDLKTFYLYIWKSRLWWHCLLSTLFNNQGHEIPFHRRSVWPTVRAFSFCIHTSILMTIFQVFSVVSIWVSLHYLECLLEYLFKVNRMSATKLEIHSILPHNHTRTKPRLRQYASEFLIKFGHLVFEICWQTDTHCAPFPAEDKVITVTEDDDYDVDNIL